MSGFAKLLSLTLLATYAEAQSPATTTADVRIAGSLTDAVTGEPVRRAGISLRYIGGAQTVQAAQASMSDAGGHFEFGGLKPGVYQLSAERRGFPRQDYAKGMGFAVTKDTTDITFRLRPFATLIGSVSDENGDPIAGASIQLIRSEVQGGRRVMNPSLATVTDDRGQYRAASLISGRYCISAFAKAQEASEGTIYTRRFFPGSNSLSGAVPLDLEGGVTQQADFRLEPEPVFHIKGQVTGAAEMVNLSISMTPRIAAEAFGGNGFPVRLSGDHFEITGVPPGQYNLSATGQGASGPSMASQLITVGGADLDGVVLSPAPRVLITGHVTVEQKEGSPLNLSSVSVGLTPDELITKPITMAMLKNSPDFGLVPLSAGDFGVMVMAPAPYFVKSAMAGGLDVFNAPLSVPATGAVAPLEIVIGWNGGEVSGTVSIQDKPVPSVPVLLIRIGGEAFAPILSGSTDANGKFLIGSVAPGDYMAYAMRDASDVEYRNPAVLSQYSGQRVTVTEGGKQAVELKLNER